MCTDVLYFLLFCGANDHDHNWFFINSIVFFQFLWPSFRQKQFDTILYLFFSQHVPRTSLLFTVVDFFITLTQWNSMPTQHFFVYFIVHADEFKSFGSLAGKVQDRVGLFLSLCFFQNNVPLRSLPWFVFKYISLVFTIFSFSFNSNCHLASKYFATPPVMFLPTFLSDKRVGC